jgi:anti-sigma B factor antagonist
MSRTALTFREETVGKVKIFHLDGKIIGDSDTNQLCTRIKDLSEKDIKHFVINFRNVKWINSLGLGSIMGCLTSLRNKGGDLRLANVHDAAMKYFKITKLDLVIEIYGTIEGAVNSYS